MLKESTSDANTHQQRQWEITGQGSGLPADRADEVPCELSGNAVCQFSEPGESEGKFRAIFDNTGDAIFIHDMSGRFLEVNKTACEQLGYTREELLRMGPADIDAPEFASLIRKRIQAIREKGSVVFESAHRRRDGSPFPVEITSRMMQYEGSPCILSVSRDISERKRIEKGLRHLNTSLEQQVSEGTLVAETQARQLQALAVELIEAEERERQRIAQLLHDDLQQILASARIQLQTACETLPSDPLLINVEAILETAIRKARRLSHELSPPVLHQSDIQTALEWLARQMEEQFGMAVQLEVETTRQFANTPLKILLFRAVRELLFNIVKHAGVMSAHIAISRAAGHLVIRVSDQGQGFDPDLLASSNDKEGLGLAGLRERARAIGGSFLIESAPGEGSRFTLSIPLRITEAAIERPVPPAGDPERLSETGGIRVLFADDHQLMRQGLIQLIAGQPDIQVAGEAENGRQALEKARRLNPDVILMDVSMPEMDGIEATRRITREFPEMRIIGLSMFEAADAVREMKEAGAAAFVSKTASSADLLRMIYEMGNRNRKICCN